MNSDKKNCLTQHKERNILAPSNWIIIMTQVHFNRKRETNMELNTLEVSISHYDERKNILLDFLKDSSFCVGGVKIYKIFLLVNKLKVG